MTSHPEFGHDTKATEVADAFPSQIKDRIVAITGISRGGLGGATALAIARQSPALLILISRTQSKLDDVISDIKSINSTVPVKAVVVDLAWQASVRKAAEEIKSLASHIDLLINNAGLHLNKRSYSPEGIETQLAANHVGPFLLTNLLTDQLLAAAKRSPPGATRVVNVSSVVHRSSPFRFHDHNSEGWPVPADEVGTVYLYPKFLKKPVDGYVGVQTYSHTKTANILFTVALNKRLAKAGVVSYSLHPGSIPTEMGRDFGSDREEIDRWANSFNPKLGTNEGASTTMVAALDPALNEVKGHNIFLEDCQFKDAEAYAVDPENAEKLWTLSEELVNQTF